MLLPSTQQLLLGLGLIIAHTGWAQTSSSTILQSAWQDQRLQAYEQELNFFSDNRALRIPVLEELEFRTETHEFDPALQEYAVRLQFNSRRQIRVQEKVNAQEYTIRQLQREDYLEELLFNRYQLLIEMYFQQKRMALLLAEDPILNDLERIIKTRLLQEGERHYDDYLELEDDQMLQDQRQELLTRQIIAARQQCNRWLGAPVDSLQSTNWPTPDQLAAYWQAWQNDTLVVPLSVQEQQLTSNLIGLELEAEQAEERNRLNFLQIRYRGENQDRILNEQITIGAGVTLPFRSANSVKEQYLKLEQLEEQNQGLERHREWLEELRNAEAQMAIELDQYDRMRIALSDYEERFSTTALSQLGISRAETYLQAARGQLKREERLLDQEQRLYESYLDVLLLSGRLISRPYRNWLSDSGALLTQ